MTAKRDFKRRVRAHQARTGGTYTAARAQVLAARDGGDAPSGDPPDDRAPPGDAAPPRPPGRDAIPVIELVELADAAARAGVRCRVLAFPALLAEVDADVALARLRAAVVAIDDDPATRRLGDVILRGDHPAPTTARRAGVIALLEEARRFAVRVRAGLGGVSAYGSLLAVTVPGRRGAITMVGLSWLAPLPSLPSLVGRAPAIILATPDALFAPGALTRGGLP